MARPSKQVPWLEENGSGTFYVHWYDQEARRTKRISLATKDAAEAQGRFAAFLSGGQEVFADRGGHLTVSQGLDDYLKEHVRRNCADVRRQEDIVGHLKEFFGSTEYRDVDVPLTSQYAEARRAGRIGGGRRRQSKVGSDATIRRELVTLRAAANHAIKWRRLERKDAPSIDWPDDNEGEPLRDDEWYTRDEIARLMTAEDDRLRRFIRISYYTAARRRSIEKLRRGQINMETRQINLHPPGMRRTCKRRPVVPLFDEIRPDIEALLEETDSDLLFSTHTDMYRPFRRHCEAIGLGHKRNPHILRHSRATHLLQDNKSIYSVAKLLGDTVATVERVYGHHSPEFLHEVLGQAAE
jgi:integrase